MKGRCSGPTARGAPVRYPGLLSPGPALGPRAPLALLTHSRAPSLPPCSFASFQGCGGAGTWDLTTIELKTTVSARQTLCLDGLSLLPGSGAGAGASAAAAASSSRRLLAGRRAAAHAA